MADTTRADGGVAVTTRDVQSRSYDVLETLLLGLPVLFVLLAGGMAAVSLAGMNLAYGVAALWLLSVPFGLVLAVAVPVLLYFDAKELGEHDLDWTPNPGLYVVLGLLFTGLAALHYLYRRQEIIRDEAGGDRWWLLAVGGVVGPVVVAGLASATSTFGLFPLAFGFALLLPVGVYKDAEFVRAAESGWDPNPTMQFTVASISGFFVVFSLPYLGYYLYKRYTSVGPP